MSNGYTIVRLANPNTVIRESLTTTTVIRQPDSTVIVSPGIPGPQGPAGPGGGGAGYTHTQGPASALWTITHNLGYRPAVTSYDTADDQIVGNVDHVSANVLTIGFTTAVSGVAYMS